MPYTTQRTILRKKIGNSVFEILPKTIAEQLIVEGYDTANEVTLAAKLLEIAAGINSKVPEQLTEQQTFTQWKASVDAALSTDLVDYDTLNEIASWITSHQDLYTNLVTRINGIDNAVTTLNGDASVTGSVDYKIASASQDLADDISRVEGKADTNTAAIELLNGADSVTGSVANAVKTASDALEASISTVDGKADNNAAAIEVLNGADSVTGSVANAVKTASDALEASISAVDGKADDNAAAIEVLNGADSVTGSVDQKIATAVATINNNVNAKGAVIYSATEPESLGENDLWIAPVA